jgi:hypothetical protein
MLSPILKKMLIGRAFSNEKGRITLYGKMDWMMFPARGLAMNFQSIAEKNGPEYLRKLGREAGRDAGIEIIKASGHQLKPGWTTQKIITALLDFIGFGILKFTKTDIGKDGHHHIKMHITHNPVIEHGARLYGKKSMVCEWFMGVYEAHGELELGIKNAKLKENHCLKDGFPQCEWESKW